MVCAREPILESGVVVSLEISCSRAVIDNCRQPSGSGRTLRQHRALTVDRAELSEVPVQLVGGVPAGVHARLCAGTHLGDERCTVAVRRVWLDAGVAHTGRAVHLDEFLGDALELLRIGPERGALGGHGRYVARRLACGRTGGVYGRRCALFAGSSRRGSIGGRARRSMLLCCVVLLVGRDGRARAVARITARHVEGR